MKKRQFYGLVITILIATQLLSITFASAECKETEISRKVPLPGKITISPFPPTCLKKLLPFQGGGKGFGKAIDCQASLSWKESI